MTFIASDGQEVRLILQTGHACLIVHNRLTQRVHSRDALLWVIQVVDEPLDLVFVNLPFVRETFESLWAEANVVELVERTLGKNVY